MNSKYEKGQVLVILALALVVLLGFTSLAVDLGVVYSDRRYTQNAADSAALAGARAVSEDIETLMMKSYNWNCDYLSPFTNPYNAAIERAAANAFALTYDADLGTPGHDHGIKIICVNVVDDPLTSFNEGDDPLTEVIEVAQRYVDVIVMLSKVTSTSFVHLFNNGVMRNTVTAVTRVEPGHPWSDGANLVSTSFDEGQNQGCTTFSGNSSGSIDGICSNSCIEADSNTNFLLSGDVYYQEDSHVTGITSPIPVPITECYITQTENLVPNPKSYCTSLPSYGNKTNFSGHLEPGNYGTWLFHGPVDLAPGLYCVSGTVTMNAGAYITGRDVTIYYSGTDFTLNGGADSILTAPNCISDIDGDGFPEAHCANPPGTIEDLLMYVENPATIKINGTSGSTFGGTIYSPTSVVTINGTADSANPIEMFVSIIAYDIDISGTSNLQMIYLPDMDGGNPSYLRVDK